MPHLQKIPILILLIFLTGCLGKLGSINPDIENKITAGHINIPGTRLYLIMPGGYKLMTGFNGIQKNDNTGILVFDNIGSNYYEESAKFTKTEFEKKKNKVLDLKDIKINGYPAKYAFLETDGKGKQYQLIFGDSSFFTLTVAMFPSRDMGNGITLMNAINTISYDKTLKIDPFKLAAFSVDMEGSAFKFLNYGSLTYTYTIDGSNDNSYPMISISQFPDQPDSPKDLISKNIFTDIKRNGLTDMQIKNASTEDFNGYEAYQEDLYAKNEGQSLGVYFCGIKNKNHMVLFEGVANEDIENELEAFKKIAKTLHLK